MEFVIMLWIVCAITAAVIAVGKGRSGFGWFIMGLLFSIFGIIMIACLPAKNQSYAVAGWPDADSESGHSPGQNAITIAVLIAVIVFLAMMTT